MTISTTQPVRLNAKSSTRKPSQIVTSNNLSGRISPSKIPPPSKLPESRTPLNGRRPTSIINPSPNRHPVSSSQTPILKLKREIKSRLPRVAPTPSNSQNTGSLSNSDTKRLRIKKNIPKPSALTSSSPSTLATSPRKSPPPLQKSSPLLLSESSIDPDQTPKRSRPGQLSKQSNEVPVGKKVVAPQARLKRSDVEPENIIFPTIVEDLTPKRPMTRARSKHLLNLSTSTEASSLTQSTGIPIPQVKRKTSRVIEIAKAYQSQSLGTLDRTPDGSNKLRRKSSQSLLGVTPDRRKSDASNSSFISPSGSMVGNSPNISALAASLSKQFGQRDRLSKGRTSITDMLRYSTMSTLGELHWEDGAGEVLLTDPNETEAMVADISMTRVTPLKSEVQSAAIALASARTNFLNIVQENDYPLEGSMEGIHQVLKDPSTPSQMGFLKKKASASGPVHTNGLTPMSKSRIGLSASNSPSNRAIVAHEAQLATLTSLLEKSQQRETELEKEIQRLMTSQEIQVGREKRGIEEEEREKSLEEEIKRLEEELEECKESNIELENSLDLARFENQQHLNTIRSLQVDSNNSLSTHLQYTSDTSNSNTTLSSFHRFDQGLTNHLAFIKESLQILRLLNLSLAISSHLFVTQDSHSS